MVSLQTRPGYWAWGLSEVHRKSANIPAGMSSAAPPCCSAVTPQKRQSPTWPLTKGKMGKKWPPLPVKVFIFLQQLLMLMFWNSPKVGRDKSTLPLGLMELRSDEAEGSEPNTEFCTLSLSPKGSHQGFHYGGIANSRQHYTDLPESFSER